MPAFYPEGDEPKLADPSGRSLHKINNLLKSIDAKTGSTTITGPVTVNNEVEVTNSTGNPIPVSGTVGLDSTSLAALENISVTFPATQNVNVTNAGLSVSVSNLPATQPVSLASAPVTPVTDNGGSLTVDGTVTVNDMTSGNAKTKIVDSTGADVSYIPAGTAGTPSSSVVTVQGISGGEAVFVVPDSPSLAAGIQYQLDNNGPITRPQDIAGGIDYYINNISGAFSVYDPDAISALGNQSNNVATSDTGVFSIIALIKRGLQNWTSLLAKIPALVSGRIPVDGSGVTQPVSLASVPSHPVTGTFWQATQPVSLASAPVTPVTDNGGSLTVDGTITAAQATAANLNATVVGSGSFTAAQATASNLKAQAQLLDSAGSLLTYAATGTAGTPAVDVVSVQGVSSGVAIATQIRNNAGSLVTYAESGIYGNPSVDVISVQNPQGTSAAIATFTSTTASSSLVAASTTRKTLTVYNSGPGDLNISPTALCTTTNFQIRLGSNDYWECPAQQVTLAHTAVYSTSGTAYVTTVT
jgi:hypothetical protein